MSLRIGDKPQPHIEGHLQVSLRPPDLAWVTRHSRLSCPLPPGVPSPGGSTGAGGQNSIRRGDAGGQNPMKKRGWGGLSPMAVAASLDDVSDSQEGLRAKNPPAPTAGCSGGSRGAWG